MTLTYHRKRLADFAAGARLSRELAERERWPRERLARFQQERLDELVGHAVQRSAFYRERIGRPTGPVELGRLPTLDKATMMEHFDELVTDPRLRRDELLAHVEALTGDALHLGRYRAMTTSGSSGRKGLFVYDRPAWRATDRTVPALQRDGRRPPAAAAPAARGRARRRLRIAHEQARHADRRRRAAPRALAAGHAPADAAGEELNRFQPQFINAYPSVAVLLAEEQLAGRLRIGPEAMSTSSELRTPEMTARIQEAFGVRPFDLYGTTEGLWGAECEHHAGIHLFEDMTIVENVDDDGRPVPDGQPGARLLVTSLFNHTQPLIRLEVADASRSTPTPARAGARCGASARSHGRSDDVLALPGTGDATVAVHPLQFAVVARDRDVVEFQVVQEGPRLRLLVVARGEAPALETRLRTAVEQRLRDARRRRAGRRGRAAARARAPAGRQAPDRRGRPRRPSIW